MLPIFCHVRPSSVDSATHQEVALLTGHTGRVRSVAFSPDGHTVASGSADDTIRVWDANTGNHLQTLDGHTSSVYSVAFNPDGSTIATGRLNYFIDLWNGNTGELLRRATRHSSSVWSVAFSPSGRTLASGSDDATIRLWDADTGKHLQVLNGHRKAVRSVAFSPDGRTLASGGHDTTIQLWDAHSGELLRTLIGHTDEVRTVAFSHNGHTLASGSRDGTVLLWDASFFVQLAVEPSERRITTLGNIKRTALLQNYPNPFNPETWIPYQLASDATVTLNIYDQSGHIVRTLDIGHQGSGVYRDKANAAYWDGRNQNGEPVTSGAYYIQLDAGEHTARRRMVVVK